MKRSKGTLLTAVRDSLALALQQQVPLDALALMRRAGLEPDPWQIQVAQTPGDQLLKCHRQAGKSTIVAAIGLADACAAPENLVLLLSRSLRQSGELFRKVKEFYRAAMPLPLIQESALSLELSNHSRIVSLPGNEGTIVGFSKVTRLILDEAARIADATYYAVRPMLAMSQGSLVALSTPFGQRGWFYEAWENQAATSPGLDAATVDALLADLGMVAQAPEVQDTRSYRWARTALAANQNPRLSRRFLANERREVPDLWFRQEWLCEFVETGAGVFRPEDIDRILTDDVAPLGRPWEETIYQADTGSLLTAGAAWRH